MYNFLITNFNMTLSVLTGTVHLLFGIYVFRLKPRQKTQVLFLILSVLLSIWFFIQGFRVLLPLEYRNFALNINFIPISYAPFTLYILCAKLVDPAKRISTWAYITAALGLSYFTFACFFEKMATLNNPENFVYELNLHYHLYVLYLVFWVVLAIYTVVKKMFVRRGDSKVRLFLILLGAILVLPLTTLFVYFLPLFGIFHPSLSSFGLTISSIIWGVAILHFDAFEIKLEELKGRKIPFINKAASKSIMLLFRKLDPLRFIQKTSKQRTEITKQILIHDYNLITEKGELSVEKRAQTLSKKFGKYFK